MKKIGIVVVAYNAAATLAQVLDRIPREFVPRISGILVCDNYSEDATYLVGLGYQQLAGRDLPLTVLRQDRNLGYGGNQKTGYRWAIEQDFDIAVLLHGDGQYAPELLPEIVAPLEGGEADAVFGSRMMVPRDALKGGMPMYKYIGNRVLTAFENRLAGTGLSEWHSGYRAYSVDALRAIPFEDNSDDYDFDTGIILQLHEAGKHIVEIPIPTFYGDEISYVNGMRYAKDIARQVVRYRANKLGIGLEPTSVVKPESVHEGTAHQVGTRVLQWMDGRPPGSVLCLADRAAIQGVGAELAGRGHAVTAIDIDEHADLLAAVEKAVAEAGTPDAGGGFDAALLVGALERSADPVRLLALLRGAARPGGTVLVVTGNVGHWYPRTKVALGRFEYEDGGILDRRNLRLFTRSGVEGAAAAAGYGVRRREPLVITGAEPPPRRSRVSARADALGVLVAPGLFAARWLLELSPVQPVAVEAGPAGGGDPAAT